MYEAFYGFSGKPFQLNPDPGFYFGSMQHRRAKAYLEYGLQRNEGFIVITGEVGAGKTTIIRGLLAGLDRDKVVAANLVTTQLDADDTLRMVGAAFGVRVNTGTKADVLMALEAHLLMQARQGKRCLLIVDEAQNLTSRAVEELRMLSNFQFEQQALLQTFLVGQPEFRSILQSPALLQLRQRVIATCHIGPLDHEETQAYIEHRLKCAGASGIPTISTAAHAEIFASSGGIPRRINFICDRLLLLGYLNGKSDFGVNDVNQVVNEIKGEAVVSSQSGSGLRGDWSASCHDGVASDPLIGDCTSKAPSAAALATTMSLQIDGLGMELQDDRLRRLERGMLRLERIDLEILSMLKRLLAVANKANLETTQ